MEILFSVSGILWTTDNIKFMIIKAYYWKKYIDGSNYNADTLIRVRTEGTREWGYCDEDGNLQIAEQFNLAGNMHNGIAKVGRVV